MKGMENVNEIMDINSIDVVNHDSISTPPRTIPIVLFKLTMNK